MGRTFEVLGGRSRRAAGAETVAAIPFPQPDPEPEAKVELVPVGADDLPPDDDGVPHVEVGLGIRTASAGPQLLAPKPVAPPPASSVAFQLLPGSARSRSSPADDLIAYHRPEHPTARQYRRLVDGIAAHHTSGRAPVLVFCPVSARSAGSGTVANLAVTRAGDGFGRVLVVELDRAAGSAGTIFDLPPGPGLKELLARTLPLGLVVHRTGVEGLFVMPAGQADVGVDELDRLPAVLDQLRARYDWILVEGPAWGTHPLGDWAKASDGVYLILNQDEWDSPVTDAAHDGIARAGGRLKGCVTTRV
jgi:Mrp family chromosome partitioning ATPase